MGNPAGSNRWGLPHLGLAIRSLLGRFAPLQLTIRVIDRNQELRKARRIFDRPESFKRRAENRNAMSGEQADGDDSLTRHATPTDGVSRRAKSFACDPITQTPMT